MYFYVDNFNELNATVVTLIKIITYNSVALKLESNTATNIEQLKEFFNKLILKKAADDNISIKNFPVCKELITRKINFLDRKKSFNLQLPSSFFLSSRRCSDLCFTSRTVCVLGIFLGIKPGGNITMFWVHE